MSDQCIKDKEYYFLAAEQGRLFRKALEWLLACSSIILGITLITISDSLADMLYAPMYVIAEAWIWGIIFILIGNMRAIVLFINGYWPSSSKVRKFLSMASLMIVWAPLAACFWWNFVFQLLIDEPKYYPAVVFSSAFIVLETLILYSAAVFVYTEKQVGNG